ncbi:MAG: magnesium protoporphyrin IX methyltransferase [Acetobacteraceae bacterium]|nr:magnesium protoporphyrin IX methyltransferase [Acetobacteraceae bacterium]
MSGSATYLERRAQLETYFDRTAAAAWARLTSDAPVSGIRATVRAGRDRMRATLLSYLPADLTGLRILDAGCGTGALAVEAAERGAEVVAIDLSPTLVGLARERAPQNLAIDFRTGDMADPALGRFDHVVAMDSLIHYRAPDMARAASSLAARAERSLVFTFAPRTPLLSAMHAAGQLFPRGDRSPAIEPVTPGRIRKLLEADGLCTLRSDRVAGGFYISQALEVVRG